jgi:transposase
VTGTVRSSNQNRGDDVRGGAGSTAGNRRFDVIRVEDLKIPNMVRSARGTIQVPGTNVRAKAGLNRSIHANGWVGS